MTSMSEIAKENIESKKTVSSDTDSSIKRFEERLKKITEAQGNSFIFKASFELFSEYQSVIIMPPL